MFGRTSRLLSWHRRSLNTRIVQQPPVILSSQRLLSTTPDNKEPSGVFDRLFGLKSCEASPDFKNRWLMVVPAFLTQMSIGSTYAWSLMGDAITREIGFVAPVAADWSLTDASLPLSLVFVVLGSSAAVLGPWQNAVGARKALFCSSIAFGGGLLLGAVGIHYHMLPLVYLGYGVLGGAGLGLGYTPPIQTLIQWFPDKKGLASGMAIAGFGSGALAFTPLAQQLMKHFAVMPEYLGPTKEFQLQTLDGKLFAEVNGRAVEVVEALSADIARLPYDLAEGLYIVGSGSTGAAEALAVLGGAYFAIILGSALTLKKPHSSFVPEGFNPVPTTDSKGGAAIVPVDVSMPEAIRSPQFHLLGLTFTCTAMGGLGIFSVAKPMMSEVFSGSLPALVTSSFAAQYILMLSMANLGGRLGWAAVSDVIGRRKTFALFTLASVPLYLSLPYHITSVVEQGSSLPLFAFIGSTIACISFMGGTYAILPAYESDLYGSKNVGPTHGIKNAHFSYCFGVSVN